MADKKPHADIAKTAMKISVRFRKAIIGFECKLYFAQRTGNED